MRLGAGATMRVPAVDQNATPSSGFTNRGSNLVYNRQWRPANKYLRARKPGTGVDWTSDV